MLSMILLRPLQNAPFCPIPASVSNFNPQNTQCIPACPVGPADRTGVIKIFAFLGLEPRLNIKYGFNWAGKIEHFSKVSNQCLKIKSAESAKPASIENKKPFVQNPLFLPSETFFYFTGAEIPIGAKLQSSELRTELPPSGQEIFGRLSKGKVEMI